MVSAPCAPKNKQHNMAWKKINILTKQRCCFANPVDIWSNIELPLVDFSKPFVTKCYNFSYARLNQNICCHMFLSFSSMYIYNLF